MSASTDPLITASKMQATKCRQVCSPSFLEYIKIFPQEKLLFLEGIFIQCISTLKQMALVERARAQTNTHGILMQYVKVL
jgi:hypothetical protein